MNQGQADGMGGISHDRLSDGFQLCLVATRNTAETDLCTMPFGQLLPTRQYRDKSLLLTRVHVSLRLGKMNDLNCVNRLGIGRSRRNFLPNDVTVEPASNWVVELRDSQVPSSHGSLSRQCCDELNPTQTGKLAARLVVVDQLRFRVMARREIVRVPVPFR